MEHSTPGAFQPMLAVATAMASKDDARFTHREAIAAINGETAVGEDE